MRNIEALRDMCLPYLRTIRVVTPEFDIYLVPDDMIEDSMIEDSEDFLQLEAATWSLARVGADQRGRAGAGSTIFV